MQQPGVGRPGRSGEADDVAVVVDGRGGHARARDVDGGELAAGLVQLVGVRVAAGVGVEPDRGARVVDAQDLVNAPGLVRGLGVGVGGERPVPLHEAAVGVLAVHPEPCRVAQIVQRRHLGLHRAGEVLAGVVRLAVRRVEQVALVGVAGVAGAEVPGDHVVVVDAEQLVERRVGVVVEGGEAVAGRRASPVAEPGGVVAGRPGEGRCGHEERAGHAARRDGGQAGAPHAGRAGRACGPARARAGVRAGVNRVLSVHRGVPSGKRWGTKRPAGKPGQREPARVIGEGRVPRGHDQIRRPGTASRECTHANPDGCLHPRRRGSGHPRRGFGPALGAG